MENDLAGTEHAAHVRVTELAPEPEGDVLLEINHTPGSVRVGVRFQLGKGLLEAVAPVDSHRPLPAFAAEGDVDGCNADGKLAYLRSIAIVQRDRTGICIARNVAEVEVIP